MSRAQYDLTNNQIRELKEAFDVFDKDHSGSIDAKELKSVLKSLGLGNTDAEFNSLMKSMDRNGDGSISFVEFAKVMGSNYYVKKSKDDILAIFRQYDKDHNGSISVDELYEIMGKFRGNLTKAECKALIAKVDKDGNGSISIAEFLNLIA